MSKVTGGSGGYGGYGSSGGGYGGYLDDRKYNKIHVKPMN